MGDAPGEIRFDGRVAIVTGSGGGLGRAYATELARRGAKVVVNDIGGDPLGKNPSAGPAAETAARLRELGGEAIANTDTVATPEGGAAIVQTALDTWGRVDVIVNNAGVVPSGQSIGTAPKEEWDRVVDVHLGGAVNVLRAAWPAMAEAGYGRVVNISSSSAFGMPMVLAYGTAKSALVGLTKIVAVEGADLGIKVNALMPTAMTRMTDNWFGPAMDQLLELSPGTYSAAFPPERVAPAVALLAHEDVPCSGEVFAAGGGRMTRIVYAETEGARADTSEGFRDAWDQIFQPDRLAIVTDVWVNEKAHHSLDRVPWLTTSS
jgi:NAD(P)-dependent dehydrogenase (short-subunit alcohol dehydrogenase family)